MTASTGVPAALLISGDLFFTSRITGTGSAVGVRVEVVSNPAQALERAASGGFRCVLLDLDFRGLSSAELMAALAAEKPPPVIAFGPHVATAKFEEARNAGCTEVLPRSRFTAILPDLLRRYGGVADGTA